MNVDFKELREKVEKITTPGEVEKLFSYDTPYKRFYETAKEKPDQLALKYMGRTYTYKELLQLADDLANGFYDLGVRKDDVVTVSMLGTPYGIATFYALDKIGACQHMVNSSSGIDELKRELKTFDSKYFVANDIFCNEETLDTLKAAGVEKVVVSSLLDGMPNVMNYDKGKYLAIEKLKGLKSKYIDQKDVMTIKNLESRGKNCPNIEPASYEDNHLSVVSYTSGSMGQSKAIDVTWNAIDAFIHIYGMTEAGRYEQEDTLFDTFPLWINYSLFNMVHEPICLGMCVALDPIFEPKNIVRRNEQYGINHWPTIPPYVEKVADINPKMDCSSWKVISVGGTELTPECKSKVDDFIAAHNGTATIVQGYGNGECLGSVSYGYYDNPTPGTLGKPCIGIMTKFVDPETRDDLGPDAREGLLYICSPAMMIGYHNDVESTNNSLVKDENGVTWFNTEDIMRLNDRGELIFVDRLRRMSLTVYDGKPAKIVPAKTEQCISKLDDVESVAVITVPDEKVVNKAIAYIVTKDGVLENETLKSNIIDFCSANVSGYQVPQEVIFIPDMPLTTSKKPDFKVLAAMYEQQNGKKEVNKETKKKSLFSKKGD